MAIDTSGKWWVGSNQIDIKEYLEAYASEGFEVSEFILAKCECGSQEFNLYADDNEGAAKRVCTKCNKEHLICDSAEFWNNANSEKFECIECSSETVNIGVGFSFDEDSKEVKWIYVGQRCTHCGILGCFTEWKINYSPTRHLLKEV